jgi:hypothetical protein
MDISQNKPLSVKTAISQLHSKLRKWSTLHDETVVVIQEIINSRNKLRYL